MSCWGEKLSSEDLYEQLVLEPECLGGSVNDYQAVAKSFGYRLCPGCWDEGKGETGIFSYQKSDSTGVIFHVGWYADGFIVTQLDGTKEGFQTIVWGNQIVDVSYPSNRETGKITNGYSWGCVEITPERQLFYGLNFLEK